MAQAIEYKEATFLLLVHLQKKKKRTEVHQSYLSVCHSTTYMSNLELTQRGYDSLNSKQLASWAEDWVIMLPTEY